MNITHACTAAINKLNHTDVHHLQFHGDGITRLYIGFDSAYFPFAGKGVPQAAEEGSSGIWILRLGLR